MSPSFFHSHHGKNNCPLCKKSVRSDAAAASFCELCGMPLEKTKSIILRIHGDAYKFCSQRCMQQFYAARMEALT